MRQLELGLSTVKDYEHVIQGLLGRTTVISKRKFNREVGKSDSAFIVVGKKLTDLTRFSLENARLQKSYASFQALVLLSYCQFLQKRNVSEAAIDELVQHVTNIRERDRKTLRDTIPWIHRLILGLIRNGWSLPPATELFCISMLQRSQYRS